MVKIEACLHKPTDSTEYRYYRDTKAAEHVEKKKIN